MSITNELREWMRSLHTPNSPELKTEGFAIADRIDGEHQKAIRELNNLVDTSVSLPVDADGVPIHIGDVMDGVDRYDPFRKVTGTVFTLHFRSAGDSKIEAIVGVNAWTECGISHSTTYLDQDASVYRHHHEPTVNEVLQDMVVDWDCAPDGEEKAEVLKEYAAKFRLANDGEEQ